jgi:hypothetical protein
MARQAGRRQKIETGGTIRIVVLQASDFAVVAAGV